MEFEEEEMGWVGSGLLYALHVCNILEFPWCLTHFKNWPHEVILTVCCHYVCFWDDFYTCML